MNRQTDFEELAKKKIKYKFTDGTVVDALVVDANYFVGITIVDSNNTNVILHCINYKNFMKMNKSNKKNYYTANFYSDIEQIKSGIFDVEIDQEIDKKFNDGEIYPDTSPNSICPWR